MTHDGWLMIVCGSSYYLDLPIAILPSYLGTVMTHCGWEPLQTSQYNGCLTAYDQDHVPVAC